MGLIYFIILNNFRQDFFVPTYLWQVAFDVRLEDGLSSCNVCYCCPLLTKTVIRRQTLVIFPVPDFMKIRSATLELSVED